MSPEASGRASQASAGSGVRAAFALREAFGLAAAFLVACCVAAGCCVVDTAAVGAGGLLPCDVAALVANVAGALEQAAVAIKTAAVTLAAASPCLMSGPSRWIVMHVTWCRHPRCTRTAGRGGLVADLCPARLDS